MRAEKEQWESIQSRLESDFAAVQQERAKLQHSIDTLNSIHGEHERTRAEERAKLERRIDELQREMTTLRSQVDQAREAKTAAERKVEQADARIAAETADLRKKIEEAEATIATKTSEGESAKRIGLNWQKRAKTLEQEVNELKASSSDAGSKAVAEKEAEVAKLRSELEEATKKAAEAQNSATEVQAKLTETEAKLAEAEKSSQSKDATVSQLQSELAAVKKAAEGGQSSDATTVSTSFGGG